MPDAAVETERPVKMVKLKGSDGEPFEVEDRAATVSKLLETMLDSVDESDTIPLENVSEEMLRLAMKWAEHHKDDPPMEDDEDDSREKRSDDIETWDADFLPTDQTQLFDLVKTANFLEMKGLLRVCCKTIANMMKGHKPETVRQIFNIRNDLTPEEVDQIRRENEWCEEK